MEITADTVRAVARLARLRLEDAEVERMRRDMAAMLDYVEQLSELDLTDVPPTAHVLDVPTPFRDADEVRSLPAAEAVRNAPKRDDSAYVVPKVIE